MGQMLWGHRVLLSAVCATASALTAASLMAEEQTTANAATTASTSYAASDAAADRIESVLSQKLRAPISEVEAPLNQVFQVLAEDYDIQILFDTASLDAVAASPEVQVTIDVGNVSLRSAFDLILKAAGEDLTYIIDNEVLLITTHEEAEKRLEVVVYRVDDLLDGDEATCERLIDVIVASIEHESWMENGTGEGEARSFPPGMIVISQTRRVHTGIGRLLDHMRTAKQGIIADSAGRRTEVARRPVTRAIQLDDKVIASCDETRKTIQNALKNSVDWSLEVEGAKADELFLKVLPNRILVRHAPQVVRQVERMVKVVSPPDQSKFSGSLCGGSGGKTEATAQAEETPDLAEPTKAGEDGEQRQRAGGEGFF